MAKTDDDESLKPFSLLREEDIKIQRRAGKELTTSYSNSRIKASFIVGEDNDTPRRNSTVQVENISLCPEGTYYGQTGFIGEETTLNPGESIRVLYKGGKFIKLAEI